MPDNPGSGGRNAPVSALRRGSPFLDIETFVVPQSEPPLFNLDEVLPGLDPDPHLLGELARPDLLKPLCLGDGH